MVRMGSRIEIGVYLLVALEVLATLAIGLYPVSGSLPIGAIVFYLWTISPYFFLIWLIKTSKCRTATVGVFSAGFLVGLFGLMQIFDLVIVNPDPQNGILYLFTPLWQWMVLLIVCLPLRACLNKTRISR